MEFTNRKDTLNYGYINNTFLLSRLDNKGIKYQVSKKGNLWVLKKDYEMVTSLDIIMQLKTKDSLTKDEKVILEILNLNDLDTKFVTISKSTSSIYYYAYINGKVYTLRISDHYSNSFNNNNINIFNKHISLKVSNKEKPIEVGTKMLEERYGRKGVVIKSNNFVTLVDYGFSSEKDSKSELEKYLTSYAKMRLIS